MEFSSTSPFSHIQIALSIFAIIEYCLTNLPKPQSIIEIIIIINFIFRRYKHLSKFVFRQICIYKCVFIFVGKRCSSSFGCSSFCYEETGVAKKQFVLLEIYDAYFTS